MLKGLKKIVAACFLLVAILAIGMPQTVKAEEMVTVYVETPADWQSPCVWAWDDDGNNAFAAWPGGACEQDADNAGWYYTWIPSWANHVIVNANEGSVQTGEIMVEGKNVWISVEDADNAQVSYDAQTKGDVPAYVEKFTVHASVPSSWDSPCLWAWSAPDGTNVFDAWPGEAMKATDDGSYEIAVPTWVNSIIVNANEGSVQTEDISIDAAEIWVTVAEDASYEISYDDPNAVEAPDINVYVMAPQDWASPCLWAWSAPDGTNAFASWPGEALEDNGDGWYVKAVPGWVNSIIVNGNEGSVQTSDMAIEIGKDVWVVVNGPEDYTITYEAPELAAEEQTTEAASAEIEEKAGVPVAPIAAGAAVVAALAIGGGVYASKKKSR